VSEQEGRESTTRKKSKELQRSLYGKANMQCKKNDRLPYQVQERLRCHGDSSCNKCKSKTPLINGPT